MQENVDNLAKFTEHKENIITVRELDKKIEKISDCLVVLINKLDNTSE